MTVDDDTTIIAKVVMGCHMGFLGHQSHLKDW